MFQSVPVRHSINYQNQNLSLETGLLALQATSSVVATIGETTVMANVVIGKPSLGDYFPLQVIYEEKLYASGKIKGSRFIKREGRPSDNAVLTGRAVDRSLRSLFDDSLRNEVQIIITVLSLDETNPPDTLSVLAASAALTLASKDFKGPVSSIRIGLERQNFASILLEEIKNGSASTWTDTMLKVNEIIDPEIESNIPVLRDIFQIIGKASPEMAITLRNEFKASNKLTPLEIQKKYNGTLRTIANPSYDENAEGLLDLIVSGDGTNIMMVEAGAGIITEEEMGVCLDRANEELMILTKFQNEFINLAMEKDLAKKVGMPSKAADLKFVKYWKDYETRVENILFSELSKQEKNEQSYGIVKHQQRVLELAINYVIHQSDLHREKLFESDAELAQELLNLVETETDFKSCKEHFYNAFHDLIKKVVQNNILHRDRRVDGRKLDETRQITCQIDVLPRVHGSSLFSRGETQVLNVLTLGTMRDAQTLDDMENFDEEVKRYLHHYNFPSYSVGETGRYGGVGRREIGHGALAERALIPVIPTEEKFPYTMRLVSECLGSNGSTSMASTCGSSLSLLAGGVPVKDVVAGVAMGLVLENITNDLEGFGNIKLETERLTLRPIQESDAEDYYNSYDEETANLFGIRKANSIEEQRKDIKRVQIDAANNKYYNFAVLNKAGEFLGCATSFTRTDGGQNIGIWIKKSARNNKFGLEAVQRIIDWVKENLKFNYISYFYYAENEISKKICEKLVDFKFFEKRNLQNENTGKFQEGLEYRLPGNFTPKFKVLTDIQGMEDHLGDMDFKVTGTADGITALQLDNKVAGLTADILKQALIKAKVGRLHILDIMKECIAEPRSKISSNAPGVSVINVPIEKIGDVIGSGGKIIKSIEQKFGVDVDLDNDTGRTYIYGKETKAVKDAEQYILGLIKEYEAGEWVEGTVFRVETYGAFIRIDGGDKEGMCHISRMSEKRVEKVEDVVKVGDRVKAKIVEVNDRGQISLSLV
jgi:polyribonucleotide nucleotidyltransferase/RimJ/RimL family protein N-acetyltransferase